jgi:hypothetical protein
MSWTDSLSIRVSTQITPSDEIALLSMDMGEKNGGRSLIK